MALALGSHIRICPPADTWTTRQLAGPLEVQSDPDVPTVDKVAPVAGLVRRPKLPNVMAKGKVPAGEVSVMYADCEPSPLGLA